MKSILKVLAFSLIFWGTVVAPSARAEDANEQIMVGKEYYTRTNIWYESATDLSTANYHKGTILPKGTKVKITNVESKKAAFLVQPENVEFTLNYDQRSTTQPFDKSLSQLFSSKNEWMLKFSGQEQQGIKEGRVFPGMRKDAVIAAYGYPPNKFTPLLQSSNMWTYYGTGRHRFLVYFDGDKVIRTEGD